ncbi:hypothetical protein [Streptomyces sp. NPDC050564]
MVPAAFHGGLAGEFLAHVRVSGAAATRRLRTGAVVDPAFAVL